MNQVEQNRISLNFKFGLNCWTFIFYNRLLNLNFLSFHTKGWPDHEGAVTGVDAEVAREMDGFQVMLHEVERNDQSILSTAYLASVGEARSVVRTSVRYGQQLVVTLSQFVSSSFSQHNFYPSSNIRIARNLLHTMAVFTMAVRRTAK